jgi:hypothetical protein
MNNALRLRLSTLCPNGSAYRIILHIGSCMLMPCFSPSLVAHTTDYRSRRLQDGRRKHRWRALPLQPRES